MGAGGGGWREVLWTALLEGWDGVGFLDMGVFLGMLGDRDMGKMGELSAPEIRGDMVSRRSVGMLSQLRCFVTLSARWNR